MPNLPLGRGRRTGRFRLEPLEDRDLLSTGIVQGLLWNDLNGNGTRDAGEPGLAGRTVYLDSNGNGTLDAGEATRTTSADGTYSFTDLPAGSYTVAEVEPTGWVQISPGSGSAAPATVTPAIWQPLGLQGGDVQEVAFSPTTPGLVLAAINNQTYHGGLYRSVDGGANWGRLPAFDKDQGILSVAFAADGTAYAGTFYGLFRSTDGGVSWSQVELPSQTSPIVHTITADPTDANRVFVGLNGGGYAINVVRTTDGGATWQNATPFGSVSFPVRAIAIDPTDPNKVYVGFADGLGGGGQVWYSANGGTSWVNRSSGLPNAPIFDFAFDGSGGVLVAGGQLYGSQNLGVYRSTDTGASWTSLSSSWPRRQARSVAVDGSTIVVGTERDGVFRSTNGGLSWSFGVTGTAGNQVNTVRFGPGGALFAGANAVGVLKSVDAGANFAASSAGMQEFPVAAVAVNPLDPDELAVTFSNLNVGGVLTSTDGGATWRRESLPATAWATVQFAPDGTLYAVGTGATVVAPEGLYRRNSDGTWTSIGPNVGDYYENIIEVVRFDPSDPNVIFAAGQTNYDVDPAVRVRAVIWKSTDRGASWSRVYLGASNVSVQDLELLGNGSVLASLYDGNSSSPTNGGVLRSTDGGATWALSNAGLPTSVQGAAISASAQNANRVFLASSSYYSGYGLFVSNDGGATWAATGGTTHPTDVLVDPGNDQIVYATGAGGKIGRSTDGGATWTAFEGGLDHASTFYSDFHLAYTGGPVPRLFLNTWEGLYSTGLYSANPGSVTVTVDEVTPAVADFGSIVLPGQVSGTVWEDENADGIHGAEFGRHGWVVYLDADNDGTLDPGETAARSVAGGGYRITGVAPGTYTLRVQMQPKYHQTFPAGDAGYTVTVAPDGSVTGRNFGIRSDPTEIRGTLWSDDNGNGVRDTGEAGLAGWTVYLDENANGKYDGERSATTDASGNYVIANVPPGTYIVGEIRPAFYRQTSPGDGRSVYDSGLGFGPTAGAPTWADHDLSTPNVIDIWYDFRPYNGYANLITDAQKAAAVAAMTAWEQATAGKLKFTQNTAAAAADVINIGTGNLAAVGYTSGFGGVLGAGGAGGSPSLANGIAWMDYQDTWNTTVGDGDPTGGFDYFTVAGHEIGHALGLDHAENLPFQWRVLMAPAYYTEVTAWSAVDRDQVRALYGAGNAHGLGFHVVKIARGDIRTGVNFGNQAVPIPFDGLALDFGPAGSPVASGYVGASSATVYDPTEGGYGWKRGTITDVDRGTADPLTRDFAATGNAGFVVDLPNGTYDVTLTFGDALQACDQVAVYFETAYFGTVSTPAGQYLTRTYRVTVSDQQLLFEMADFGGANPQIALDALRVVRVQPSLTVSISPTTFGEGAGGTAATGTVTRGGDLSQALTVTLSSSDATEATVPTTVTIAAGQSSATFAVSAVDDTILDGTQTVTISASASGYNSGSKQVSVTDNELPPPPPPPPPPSSFDFGTASSPVASGYTQVTHTTNYTAARGYGWLSGTVASTDRGNGKQATSLTRDFNSTSSGTFVVDVPNGTYSVTITMGDSRAAHDQMNVSLEGTLFGSNLSTASNQFLTRTYTVAVSDGQLTLRLQDAGGRDPSAVINALQFVPTGGLHGLAPARFFGAPVPGVPTAPPVRPNAGRGTDHTPPVTTAVFDGTAWGVLVGEQPQTGAAGLPRLGYVTGGGDADWFGTWVGDSAHHQKKGKGRIGRA